jgi:hypothetical protein
MFMHLGFGELLILLLFMILPLVLFVIALIDLIKSEFKSPNDKLIWLIVVVFVPVIGPILYFAMGSGNKAG